MESEKKEEKVGKEGIGRWGDVSDDDNDERLYRPLPPRIANGDYFCGGLLPPPIGQGVVDGPLPPHLGKGNIFNLHGPLPPPFGKGDVHDGPHPAFIGKGQIVDGPHPPLIGKAQILDGANQPRVGTEHFTDDALPPRVKRHLLPGSSLPARVNKGHLLGPLLPARDLGDDDCEDLPSRVGKGFHLSPALPPRIGKKGELPLRARVVVGSDEKDHLRRALPPPVVTGPDHNGVKTIVDYRMDEFGNTHKVTSRTRMVPARVAAAIKRRAWAKFGDAAEDGATSPLTKVSNETISFTLKSSTVLVPRSTDVYVPPRRSAAYYIPERRNKFALTLKNLSVDADETDLKNLCIPFGPVRSVSVAKDKTGCSKGLGSVTFFHKADAKAALATLDGYAYDHLILHVEWAA